MADYIKAFDIEPIEDRPEDDKYIVGKILNVADIDGAHFYEVLVTEEYPIRSEYSRVGQTVSVPIEVYLDYANRYSIMGA